MDEFVSSGKVLLAYRILGPKFQREIRVVLFESLHKHFLIATDILLSNPDLVNDSRNDLLPMRHASRHSFKGDTVVKHHKLLDGGSFGFNKLLHAITEGVKWEFREILDVAE